MTLQPIFIINILENRTINLLFFLDTVKAQAQLNCLNKAVFNSGTRSGVGMEQRGGVKGCFSVEVKVRSGNRVGGV